MYMLYDKNNILGLIEKKLVLISLLASILLSNYFAPFEIPVNNFDLIATSLITIVVTFIGVIVTTLTLLIALLHLEVMKTIFKIESWPLFIKYFTSPLFVGLLLILFDLFLLFKFDASKPVILDKKSFIVIFSLCIAFLVSILRLSIVFVEVLKTIQSDNTYDEKNELDLTNLKNKYK